MALATRCPACGTIFRITTIQAAAKSGMVRCGACRKVFNSLDALVRVEDLDPEPEVRGEHDVAAQGGGENRVAPPGDGDAPTATQLGDPAFVDAAEPTIDTPQAVFEEEPPPAVPRPLHEGVVEPSADNPPATASDDPPTRIGARRLDLDWPRAESAAAGEPAFMRGASRPVRSAAEVTALAILSLIAALGLVGQAAYVWRDELAARLPLVKPALLAACLPLRCVVSLPARLDAIEIESSSLESTPGNRNAYLATVLLRNSSQVSVRFPAIELTLIDTQDRPLARRVFRPGDYLPREPGARRTPEADGIAPKSERPVRIAFEAAGLRVAGFRLALFYL